METGVRFLLRLVFSESYKEEKEVSIYMYMYV